VVAMQRTNEQFSKQETERRFEAALRGAFKTPPTPMKSMVAKRRKIRRRARGGAPKGSSA
jgi:hypothetical protein